MCHSECTLLDVGLLTDWLKSIKTWLDKNPNEGTYNKNLPTVNTTDSLTYTLDTVVTTLIVNSDNASPAELNSQFEAANLTSLAYKPKSTSGSWPTLQSMIDDGTRLVVFVADITSNTEYPYLMSEWDYVWENNYDVSSPSNFSCDPSRPAELAGSLSTALSSTKLPLMNHFLYSDDLAILDISYPNSSYVSTTNAASGGVGNLGSTASKCQQAYGGRQPNFILVDFFNRGPAIETVDKLNNVTNAVGRTSLSTSSITSSSDGSTINGVFSQLVSLAESARSGSAPAFGNWVWVGGDWGMLGGGISL